MLSYRQCAHCSFVSAKIGKVWLLKYCFLLFIKTKCYILFLLNRHQISRARCLYLGTAEVFTWLASVSRKSARMAKRALTAPSVTWMEPRPRTKEAEYRCSLGNHLPPPSDHELENLDSSFDFRRMTKTSSSIFLFDLTHHIDQAIGC